MVIDIFCIRNVIGNIGFNGKINWVIFSVMFCVVFIVIFCTILYVIFCIIFSMHDILCDILCDILYDILFWYSVCCSVNVGGYELTPYKYYLSIFSTHTMTVLFSVRGRFEPLTDRSFTCLLVEKQSQTVNRDRTSPSHYMFYCR